MKESKNKRKIKIITPQEVSNIDPFTISKIELLDGTVIKVQKYIYVKKEILKIDPISIESGAITNLKLNHISNSYKKPRPTYPNIEWDFPDSKTKNLSYVQNLEELSKINNSNYVNINTEKDNRTNYPFKKKNHSYYESKHIGSKKNDNNKIEKNEQEAELKLDCINDKKEDIENNNQENLTKEKNSKKNIENNNPINKNNNLTFKEKLNKLKCGLSDNNLNTLSGINSISNDNKEENNIQKINKIKPLNFFVNKTKNRKPNDINIQFEQLVNKFNENKNIRQQKKEEKAEKYLNYKSNSNKINLNININKLNNLIQKNKLNCLFSNKNYWNEDKNGSRLNILNERINLLRNKTIGDNKNSFMFDKSEQIKNRLILPSNFK